MTTPSPSVNPYAAAEVPSAGPNSLARASFVIAIVLLVISVILAVLSPLIPMLMNALALGAAGIGALFAVLGFLNLVLGGVGLVLGLLGSRRPGATLQAGVGIGVGGFVAIGALVSLIAGPIASLLY